MPITRMQKKIIEALKAGAELWHEKTNYDRKSYKIIIKGESDSRVVSERLMENLLDKGFIQKGKREGANAGFFPNIVNFESQSYILSDSGKAA